ncbi:MAG TPA: hypothetical protein VIR63_07445, partial [Pontiella sp.]
MNRVIRNVASALYLRNVSARKQAVIALCFLSVIPALATQYIFHLFQGEIGSVTFIIIAIITVLIIASATCGFLIIKKYPKSIEELRRYIEEVADGSLPDQINLANTNESDDLMFIE